MTEMTAPVRTGDQVRDSISGLYGIVVARTEWLYGCVRVTIQPQGLHDGLPLAQWTADEPQVEVLEAQLFRNRQMGTILGSDVGDAPAGDRPDPTQATDPIR